MSLTQQILTIIIAVVATQLTRFLPFIIFPENKKTPKIIEDISKILPLCVMSLLLVYCLKDSLMLTFNFVYPFVIPELIAVIITIIAHLYKKNMLLSILVGTISYMFLVQVVFV